MMTLNSWLFCFCNAKIKAGIVTPNKASLFWKPGKENSSLWWALPMAATAWHLLFSLSCSAELGPGAFFSGLCATALTSSLWAWCSIWRHTQCLPGPLAAKVPLGGTPPIDHWLGSWWSHQLPGMPQVLHTWTQSSSPPRWTVFSFSFVLISMALCLFVYKFNNLFVPLSVGSLCFPSACVHTYTHSKLCVSVCVCMCVFVCSVCVWYMCVLCLCGVCVVCGMCCMYACVCLHRTLMQLQAHTCDHQQSMTSVFLNHSPLCFLRQDLSLHPELRHSAKPVGHWAQRIHLLPPPQRLGYRCALPQLAPYVGAGDLIPDPHRKHFISRATSPFPKKNILHLVPLHLSAVLFSQKHWGNKEPDEI